MIYAEFMQQHVHTVSNTVHFYRHAAPTMYHMWQSNFDVDRTIRVLINTVTDARLYMYCTATPNLLLPSDNEIRLATGDWRTQHFRPVQSMAAENSGGPKGRLRGQPWHSMDLGVWGFVPHLFSCVLT